MTTPEMTASLWRRNFHHMRRSCEAWKTRSCSGVIAVTAHTVEGDKALWVRRLSIGADGTTIDARLTGPQWVQALPPGNIELRNQLLFSAVRGGPDLKHYPELYRPWPSDVFAVRPRLRGLEELRLDAGQKAAGHA